MVFCRLLYVAAINETDCSIDEPGIACSATSGVTPNGAASPCQVCPPSRLLSKVMSDVTPAQPRPSSANVIWVTQPAAPATIGSQEAPRSVDRYKPSGVETKSVPLGATDVPVEGSGVAVSAIQPPRSPMTGGECVPTTSGAPS